MGEVFKAIENGQSLNNPDFIEKSCKFIHNEWRKRQGTYIDSKLDVEFEELKKEEQDKDFSQIKQAIEIFEASK